jgi:tetratricopeptide (TPR) repeat protein
MSLIERWMGRAFIRTDVLKQSSWEEAELHLEEAASDWPDWVHFRYDLAALYRKRGRKDEARQAYERVTHMPAVHPWDQALKRDAERMLEELGS